MRKLRYVRGLVAAALLVAIGGCGDNSGIPVGFAPDGRPSQAVLLLSPVADTLGNYVGLEASILSPPPADGFRVYIDPAGEGFRPATEAPVPPLTSLGSGWSIYKAVVDGYDPAVPTQFVARGARDGVESIQSPLTNVGYIPATTAAALLQFLPVTITQPEDSTGIAPLLAWEPVPGAVSYLVQIYDVNSLPIYIALSTSNVHQFGVGPGVIFEQQPMRGGPHFMLVQAVDVGSRIIGVNLALYSFSVTVPPTP
ncbi:MAG: hypothetical protein ABIP29_01110 [Candidatus Eisenbacteria bacterium]